MYTSEEIKNQVVSIRETAKSHEERANQLAEQSKAETELAAVANERADLLEKSADELKKIEEKQSAITGVAIPAMSTGRRGRPKGSTNVGTGKRGRPKGSTNAVASTGKRGRPKGSTNKPSAERKNEQSLREVCLGILKHSKKGLKLDEIVVKAQSSGYNSSAKNFSNNVYQTLNALVNKDRVVAKDEEKRYVLLNQAA